jgi:hypothetical protein
LAAARANAYAAIEKIRFAGMFYRKDIGEKALKAERAGVVTPVRFECLPDLWFCPSALVISLSQHFLAPAAQGGLSQATT